MDTPLRTDLDRRAALVEIDAIAATMLGLSADQLVAMFTTQFPVLRKYEHTMLFDRSGHQITKHHQAHGIRQAAFQDQAKDGDSAPKWKRLWCHLTETDDADINWDGLGLVSPLLAPNRAAEMRVAIERLTGRSL